MWSEHNLQNPMMCSGKTLVECIESIVFFTFLEFVFNYLAI